MADLDDFFAKKDKKKKGKSGFSKANTDIISKNLEESERKSEQKAIDDSKAAQLATSEAARASMAGEDPARDREAAATPGGGGEGGGGVKGSAVSGVGMSKSNYSSYGHSGGEIVLATTDAARKANMMIGLGDDGTVTKEIVQEQRRVRLREGAHIVLGMSHFIHCCTCLTVTIRGSLSKFGFHILP